MACQLLAHWQDEGSVLEWEILKEECNPPSPPLSQSPPGGAIRTLTLFFLLWHPLSDVWWLPEPEVPQLVVVLQPEVVGSISSICTVFGFFFWSFLCLYVTLCYPQDILLPHF